MGVSLIDQIKDLVAKVPILSKSSAQMGQQLSFVYLEDLVMGPSQEYRAAVRKSEERGVADIKKLVETSPTEWSWVFLPQYSLWVSTGKEALEQRAEGNVYKTTIIDDLDFLEALYRRYNQIFEYHFHPRRGPLAQAEDELLIENGVSSETLARAQAIQDVQGALPSFKDFVVLIGRSVKFYQKNQAGNMVHKICSCLGITEYSLTQKGKETFLLIGRGNLDLLISCAKDQASTLSQGTYPPILWDLNSKHPVLVANQVASQMNSELVSVRFMPYREAIQS